MPDVIVETLASKHVTGGSVVTLNETPEGPLRAALVSARQAFAAWTALREAVPLTGVWPVVIGNRAELANLGPDAEPVVDILASAAELDLDTWVMEQVQQDPGRYNAPTGPWPDEAPHMTSFYSLDCIARQSNPAVIALAPTTLPYEVPAHLRFGGWNECPPPEAHVAFLRRWHERFGAEPVAVTDDVVELLVRRPIGTREEALQVARLQYVYCPDIVEQGTNSVEALAATLLGDPRWYFWWD
jgi:hypothetical protein